MSALKRLAEAIGSSAEYAVAAALLAVVVVVGGAAFLLTLDDKPKRRTTPAATAPKPEPTAAIQPDEQAALAEWQKILDSEAQQHAPAPEPRRAAPAPAPAPAAAAERGTSKTQSTPSPKPSATRPQVASLDSKREPVRVAAKLDRTSCRPPKYPEAAVRNNEEGVVTMGFLLDATGRVTDSRVEQSSGSRLLDQTAVNTLGRCRFAPATVDGVPQGGWVQMRFAWKLNQ